MANPFASYQYRDPENISIENLGKAAMIKDQQYDANFYKTQELINQYANTDLAKDIDKKYLGERLQTIVNYVNQEGVNSWDNRNIASQIQSYISGAIDKNVINAINSTQTMRRQDAEINEIKSKKPDQYSLQNEWFAKADRQRYLRSNVVGDTYNANAYVPYSDVNKKILENSKVLEQFGVETYRETDDPKGQLKFREIRTHKKIDPANAQKYLNSILDAQDLNQLYIDGQYRFKDSNSTEQVKALYDDKIQQYRDFNNKKIDYYKTLATSSVKSEKAKNLEMVSAYEEKNRALNKTQGTTLSREAMVNYMYTNEFFDKWTNMLSYDQITDFEIDDSGFKQWQEENRIKDSNRDYALNTAKFQYEVGQDQIKNNLDQQRLNLEMASKGLRPDGQGGFEFDPNNALGLNALGGTTSQVAKDQKKIEGTPVLKQVQYDFYKNRMILESSVADEINQMITSDNNPALREEMRGVTDAKRVAYTLINSPSKTQVIFQNLSPKAQQEVNQMRSSAKKMQDINDSLKPIVSDVKAFASAVVSNKSKGSLQQAFKDSSFGMVIDTDGNVVKGDVLEGGNNVSNYLSRLVTGFNYRLRSENLDNEDYLAMRKALQNELTTQSVVKLTPKQINNIMDNMVFKQGQSGGFWSALGEATSSAFSAINPFKSVGEDISNALSYYVFDTIDEKTYNARKQEVKNRIDRQMNVNYGRPSSSVNTQRLGFLDSLSSANEDINSIGVSDIDTEKLGFNPSEVKERTRQYINDAKEKVRNTLGQQFNTSINIGEGTKAGKATIEQIKTLYPVETQFSPTATANVVVDQEKGVANITMGVKSGKEYVPQTIEVPLASMPSSILSSIKQEPSTRLYSATNPYAVDYKRDIEIPDNQDDYQKQVSLMRADKREEALANPVITKADILNNLYNSFGNEIVNQNAEKIKQILDSPVTISTIPENGQWTTVVTHNGNQILNKKTGQEDYQPDRIDKHASKLATDLIIQKIQTVLNKNQNGRAIQY